MPKPLSTALEKHPKIAQQIGNVIGQYALLEFTLFLVYFAILGTDANKCMSKFYSLRSVNKRSELLINEMQKRYDDRSVTALRRLLRRFKSAAHRRTEIAHSAFISVGDELYGINSLGDNPRFSAIDIPKLNRTISQYQALTEDLIVFSSLVLSAGGGNYEEVFTSLHKLLNAPPDLGKIVQAIPEQYEEHEVASIVRRIGLDPEPPSGPTLTRPTSPDGSA